MSAHAPISNNNRSMSRFPWYSLGNMQYKQAYVLLYHSGHLNVLFFFLIFYFFFIFNGLLYIASIIVRTYMHIVKKEKKKR